MLDNGTKPRFNCRDAIWWWLYSIRDYIYEAPNGHAILNESVSRLFPTDDSEPKAPGECVCESHLITILSHIKYISRAFFHCSLGSTTTPSYSRGT